MNFRFFVRFEVATDACAELLRAAQAHFHTTSIRGAPADPQAESGASLRHDFGEGGLGRSNSACCTEHSLAVSRTRRCESVHDESSFGLGDEAGVAVFAWG